MASWDNRELCPDGACVGVIDETGRCSVCGRAGERPLAAEVDDEEDDDGEYEDDDDYEDEGDEPAEPVAAAPRADGDDWAARKLCSDDACIGVIGDDGRCSVCGKPAQA